MTDSNPFSPPTARVEDTDRDVPATALRYAGFWRRFGAYWLDVLVLLPLTGLALWMGEQTRLFQLYYFVPGLAIGLLFHVYLVKRYGGTPGKLMLKLRIARLDGSAVDYREALIRYSVLFVLATLTSIAMLIGTLAMADAEYFSLGFQARNVRLMDLAPHWFTPVNILLNIWIWGEFVVMLTNKRRRALHDFMAGTVVIHAAGSGDPGSSASIRLT
jgi:uncharacterized RDD family membrane protein YckC